MKEKIKRYWKEIIIVILSIVIVISNNMQNIIRFLTIGNFIIAKNILVFLGFDGCVTF